MIIIQTYLDLNPQPPIKFIPKIYGFKIFGMRGSRYELKFDTKGQPINEEEIKHILKNKKGSSQATIGAGNKNKFEEEKGKH